MATRNTNITVPKLVKPTVGKHVDTWGYILNENFDKLSEFHTKIVSDSEMQNQELARLENEKLNIEDIPSKVEPVVQEFLETTIKPEIDDYIDTVSKPDITKHVETKKQEINTYVSTTSKPALDAYEKEKEKELNTYTTTKKGELDSHTIAKKGELDAYEKTKETQLNNYTGTKQTQLDSYTNTKKGELDTHTTAKEGQLDTYTTGKEGELDTHTGKKKSELDAYEKTKEEELNTFTSTKKTEITNHTNTKKGELDTYTTQKKGEITTHTDSEIERINADSELANKVDKTDIINDISTGGTDKVLSAEMGVKLNTSGYDGQGRGTLRNNSLNIDQIKKSGAWYIYDKNLKPFIGFDYAYLQHIQYNDNDVGAWQLMCPDNKLELYTRVCAGRSGRYTDWEQILTSNNKLFLGNAGVSKIIYIQDAGEKTAGNGYVDKTTGQLYLCKTTNSDITVTNKFVLATNIENSKKLDNLSAKMIAFNTSNGLADTLKDLLLKGYKNIIVSFEGSIASPIEINLTTDTESGTNKNSFLGALVSFQIWNYGEITLRNISYDGGLKSFTSNKIGAVMTIIYSKNGVPLVYSNNLYNVVS